MSGASFQALLSVSSFTAPATSYANTGGTGDRTASITVTSDLTPASGTLSNAVDGGFANNSSDSFFFTGSIAVAGHNLRFDFGTARYISEVKWYQSDTSTDGTWKWQGSNDASVWVDVSVNTAYGGAVTQLTTLTPTALYRYYQKLGISGTGSATHFQQEYEFKIN